MPYRDDVEALEARCRALEAESAALGAELAGARQLLAESMARRRLPVLDELRIAAPCHASWDAMLGDERVRFCGRCEKNVYNLSALTRTEAQALLVAKEGKLCVRYYQREDGTVLTTDCPVGARRRSRRRRIIVAAFGAMSALTAAGAAWLGRTPARPGVAAAKTVAQPILSMGDAAAPGKPPEAQGALIGPPPPPLDEPAPRVHHHAAKHRKPSR